MPIKGYYRPLQTATDRYRSLQIAPEGQSDQPVTGFTGSGSTGCRPKLGLLHDGLAAAVFDDFTKPTALMRLSYRVSSAAFHFDCLAATARQRPRL
jgi:hypothetical protein